MLIFDACYRICLDSGKHKSFDRIGRHVGLGSKRRRRHCRQNEGKKMFFHTFDIDNFGAKLQKIQLVFHIFVEKKRGRHHFCCKFCSIYQTKILTLQQYENVHSSYRNATTLAYFEIDFHQFSTLHPPFSCGQAHTPLTDFILYNQKATLVVQHSHPHV